MLRVAHRARRQLPQIGAAERRRRRGGAVAETSSSSMPRDRSFDIVVI